MKIETNNVSINVRGNTVDKLDIIRSAVALAPNCKALVYFIAAKLVGDGVDDVDATFDDGSRILGTVSYTDIITPDGVEFTVE